MSSNLAYCVILPFALVQQDILKGKNVMDTESKQVERLIERIGKLPQKKQDAICWLINNCEFVTRLCENSTLTQTEWDEQMKKAEEKDDA